MLNPVGRYRWFTDCSLYFNRVGRKTQWAPDRWIHSCMFFILNSHHEFLWFFRYFFLFPIFLFFFFQYKKEYWLLSYIDLLQRHQFWHEATKIVKLAWLRRVCQVNQQSTSVHINCGDCGRLVSNSVSCYCSKCKSLQSSKCSVCNRVVKGVYAWCSGCSHGGHLMHMKEWFSNHSKCPRCGHLCEYE